MAIDKTKFAKVLKDKYIFENETFKREVKSNPKDRIQVEVGDSKQPDFKPQFKFMRWDNEVNFSLRAEEDPTAKVETQGEKITYKHKDYDVVMYDRPEVSEDGGFEFEWILPKKPSSNVLKTTIQTKGLKFFYQPPITPEEVAEGVVRPENVVGSYAVYHNSKGGINNANGMEYKAGKAFHIFRPKVKDVNGQETWGNLNINEQTGELTVTIDQSWLDNAVYPVVVDPTFGYTTIGGSKIAGTQLISACFFTTSEAGTLTTISSYSKASGASSTRPHAAAIYTNVSGEANGKVAEDSGNVTLTTTASWWDNSISASINNATIYWLANWTDTSSGGRDVYYDSGSTNQRESGSGSTFESWPATTFVTSVFTARQVSIYATYTAAAGTVSPKGKMTTNTFFWGT